MDKVQQEKSRFYVGMLRAREVGAGDEIRLPLSAGSKAGLVATVQTVHQAEEGMLRLGWANLQDGMQYFKASEQDQIEVLRKWGT